MARCLSINFARGTTIVDPSTPSVIAWIKCGPNVTIDEARARRTGARRPSTTLVSQTYKSLAYSTRSRQITSVPQLATSRWSISMVWIATQTTSN